MALIRSGDTDHIFERFDVFESRTATGGEVFSILTCLVTITFVLLNIFPTLEMIRLKIWETVLPWHSKCPFPVAVGGSKTSRA